MMRRTTIELDDELVQRAKLALGSTTIKATVEEALRRVAQVAEAETAQRRQRQRSYFDTLAAHADLQVLATEEMWR